MGNSQDKPPLRKALSVPDTHSLPPDAPVLYKEKSRSSQRLYQPNKGGNGKQSKSKMKKSKHQKEQQPEFQLPPSEAAFLPAFPLRGDLEDLDFEVIEVIAKGAYGNVIKVQREDDKRFYATKILDKAQILQEGAVRQCKDEASIQSMAGQHPFIVKAYEYWQSQANLYLVLEYVPHGDMFTLWTFHGAFPEDLVRLYIAEMSLVLDYLHCECVIYRDIKMENILFDAMGHIQLTDFGLAKWLQSGDNTRTVCGTLQYMAPEVLSVYPYGHPADWWSIGILMYTMLAGRYPVDGMDTHTRMAQKVFECEYLLPSNISDSAQDVINRVLTKSPHKRLCSLYHLQDLHFFQDLIFSDLTDGKINPVNVVPADFFPMTGASWAPYVFNAEDNKHFEEFDDTNGRYDGYNHNDYNTSDGYKPDHQPSQHNASSSMYNQSNAHPNGGTNGYGDRPSYSEGEPNRRYSDVQTNSNSYGRSSLSFDQKNDISHSNPQTNSYNRESQPMDTRNAPQTNSYNDGPAETGLTRAYPQPAARASTRAYNKSKQTVSANKEPVYPVGNYDDEPRRHDRNGFESISSHNFDGDTNRPDRSESTASQNYDRDTGRRDRYGSSASQNFDADSSRRDRFESVSSQYEDNDRVRRDRYDSTSNHSDMRGSQMTSSVSSPAISYNHNLNNSDSYQPQTQGPSYHSSHDHNSKEYPSDYKDSRYDGRQRRVSRDSYLAATSRESSIHSSPAHTSSTQPPSLPKNPPPPTLPSQQPFISPSRSTNQDSRVFKVMEPAPTVTLVPKNNNSNFINKPNNNIFTPNAYSPQMGPQVMPPPQAATIVTSPTAKLPPTNRMSGYGQLEEAKIELPTSPVVMSPGIIKSSQPNPFVQLKPTQQNSIPPASDRFHQPPQPPPQSAKPKSIPPSTQFHLQQPPTKTINTPSTQNIPLSTQLTPPQPAPQSNKPPTVHPKPSVAPKPKPSIAPKSNNPTPTTNPNNVLAPVPAVRKSFNAKISNKTKLQQQMHQFEHKSDPTSKPQPLHTDKNFVGPNPNINHQHQNSNNTHLGRFPTSHLDLSTPVGFTPQPQAAPRPVPVPRARPRQAAPTSDPAHHMTYHPDSADYEPPMDEQEPPSPDSCQWKLPTSAVPHFV